jgi:hypothetical protein
MTILLRVLGVAIAVYLTAAAGIVWAMLQPPERFGQVMKHLPMPVVWGAFPAPRMWSWARNGHLQEGDEAPDFTLSTFDHSSRVTLSSHRGERPVVLVFGSYT